MLTQILAKLAKLRQNLTMTRTELRISLGNHTNDEFLDREIFGRRPWIFDADATHVGWTSAVAEAFSVTKDNVWIVGSAATGYSLSPFKAGRPFRALSAKPASDIDIAITSDELFEEAWNTIVFFDRQLGLRLSKDDRTKARIDIYWGVVGQKSLPRNTDAARRILVALSAATRTPPIRGYAVKCRIYRRKEDLRAYHINSLRQLRAELET